MWSTYFPWTPTERDSTILETIKTSVIKLYQMLCFKIQTSDMDSLKICTLGNPQSVSCTHQTLAALADSKHILHLKERQREKENETCKSLYSKKKSGVTLTQLSLTLHYSRRIFY